MMPTVLRKSGPKFVKDGITITPRAMVSTCEDCGAPAAFGDNSSGRYLTYCREHTPSSATQVRRD